MNLTWHPPKLLRESEGRAGKAQKGIKGVSQEWHEDKEDLGRFVAPEGLEDSAQGFNPGNRPPGRPRPERAPDQTYKKQTRRTYLSRARNRSTLSWCALF